MTLRCERSPVAPNRTMTWGSGTRSSRRPSRSGLPSALGLARRLPSRSSRRSRIVRAGAPGGSAVLAIGRLLGLHRVAAELIPERGEDLGPVAVVLAGSEAGLERDR